MTAREMLTAYAAENGVAMEFDGSGSCTLPLDEERVLHVQFRDALGELDLLALLGPVPEASRGYVFGRLLAANYYWKDTLGATLSWHDELEQVVLAYPIRLEGTDDATLRGALDRFVDLQDAWVERLKHTIAEAEIADELEEATGDLSDLAPPAEESARPVTDASFIRYEV